jgi:hypothetical protein
MNRIPFIILIAVVTSHSFAESNELKVHNCEFRRSQYIPPEKFVVNAKNSILAIESLAIIVSTKAYGFPITSVECESEDKVGKSSLTSLKSYTCELNFPQNPELNYKMRTWAQGSKSAVVGFEVVNSGSTMLAKRMTRPENIKCTNEGEDTYSSEELRNEAEQYQCEFKIEGVNTPQRLKFYAFNLEQATTSAMAGVRLKSRSEDKVEFLGCQLFGAQTRGSTSPVVNSPRVGDEVK